MARNRQKARDRKRKNREQGAPPAEPLVGELTPPPPQAPPEDLGLPTGSAEEAFGDPVDPELEAEALAARGDLDDDGDIDEEDVALAEEAAGVPAPATQRTAAPPQKSGPRFIQFIRGCWAELQRVQWPDRRQVGQATAVVLGFVVIAGAYLGVADYVAEELVNFIL